MQAEDAGWLADVLEQQATHVSMLLADHERPAVLLRLPEATGSSKGTDSLRTRSECSVNAIAACDGAAASALLLLVQASHVQTAGL